MDDGESRVIATDRSPPSSSIPVSVTDGEESRATARTTRGREIKRVDRYIFA